MTIKDTFNRLLVAPLPYVPERIVWQLSQRYIAGVDLASAYDCVRQLNHMGCSATVDVLGEDSTTEEEVTTARDLYLASLPGIDANELDCNLSIKLSDMGLKFDHELCFDTLATIVEKAGDHGNFVRIDMEDSSVTSVTLDIYRRLRQQYDNVGIVIQSCLRRSQHDVNRLLKEDIAHVRLCKGIYVEPEAGERRHQGRHRDARPAAGRTRACNNPAPRRRSFTLRIPDAARRCRHAAFATGHRRPPAARLRAVRGALVRLFDATSA